MLFPFFRQPLYGAIGEDNFRCTPVALKSRASFFFLSLAGPLNESLQGRASFFTTSAVACLFAPVAGFPVFQRTRAPHPPKLRQFFS